MLITLHHFYQKEYPTFNAQKDKEQWVTVLCCTQQTEGKMKLIPQAKQIHKKTISDCRPSVAVTVL